MAGLCSILVQLTPEVLRAGTVLCAGTENPLTHPDGCITLPVDVFAHHDVTVPRTVARFIKSLVKGTTSQFLYSVEKKPLNLFFTVSSFVSGNIGFRQLMQGGQTDRQTDRQTDSINDVPVVHSRSGHMTWSPFCIRSSRCTHIRSGSHMVHHVVVCIHTSGRYTGTALVDSPSLLHRSGLLGKVKFKLNSNQNSF